MVKPGRRPAGRWRGPPVGPLQKRLPALVAPLEIARVVLGHREQSPRVEIVFPVTWPEPGPVGPYHLHRLPGQAIPGTPCSLMGRVRLREEVWRGQRGRHWPKRLPVILGLLEFVRWFRPVWFRSGVPIGVQLWLVQD